MFILTIIASSLLLGVTLAQDNATSPLNLGCGVPGGGSWDDQIYYDAYGPVTEFRVRHGDVVDGIQFWYGGVAAPFHGSNVAGDSSYELGPGEFISGIAMSQGKISATVTNCVCSITFYITFPDGRVEDFGPYGTCARTRYDCGLYLDTETVKYFKGFSGNYLDQMEAFW